VCCVILMVLTEKSSIYNIYNIILKIGSMAQSISLFFFYPNVNPVETHSDDEMADSILKLWDCEYLLTSGIMNNIQ